MKQVDWGLAPEWANVVVDAYSRLFYLEHNHSGKITYAQRVDGSGGRMTSTDNHVWWEFDVVDVRPDVVPYELTSDCVLGCAAMKQIIVNVSGLSVEEKQRMNEALAKITGFNKMTSSLVTANWMYAPSSYADGLITYSDRRNKEPTHTPQQVLEMAGMAEKRKVRAGFDVTKEYSVDVSGCTEDEKKKVQQAFFDAGFLWELGGKEYRHLDAVQYSNTYGFWSVTKFCMYGSSTKECNMTPTEFLDLVYEPEQRGHVHAELMAQYAEDANTTDKPWELWQLFTKIGTWVGVDKNPDWCADIQYRRKPKTHTVNGVEVPDLRFEPKNGEGYHVPDPLITQLYLIADSTSQSHSHRKDNNLCYEPTEAGKQAAILHAKAMLGIA